MSYYLVTGAAGFIGSHLVDALLAAGHRVDGIDDLSTGTMNNVVRHNAYKFIHACDHRPGWEITRWWNTIFHCSARTRIQPSFDNPIDTIRNNVTGTLEMIQLARKCESNFIYAGSSTCDSDIYANPYAFSKHVGEELCHLYSRIYDVPCTIARFYNVYGPRQIEEGPYATAMGIWEKANREGRPLPMCGTGEKRRDWTHVEDIVSGLIAISEWQKQQTLSERVVREFHLGSGCDMSVSEVLEMFGGEIAHLPDRRGEAQVTLANNGHERKLIGWEPKWRISDYIEQIKESYSGVC